MADPTILVKLEWTEQDKAYLEILREWRNKPTFPLIVSDRHDMPRTVRIVSDGTPQNTQITDAQTGEYIPNVFGVYINLEAKAGYSFARLDVFAPRVDVTLPAAIEHVCPYCGASDAPMASPEEQA